MQDLLLNKVVQNWNKCDNYVIILIHSKSDENFITLVKKCFYEHHNYK